MSTRGLYSFVGDGQTYHVYKHSDNYPEGEHGGIGSILRTLSAAWPLPRFEADEFAAAFIAVNKDGPGSVRLLASGAWKDVASSDIEYRYEIFTKHGQLTVRVFDVQCDFNTDEWTEQKLFEGTLDKALVKFRAIADAGA